MLFKSPVIHLLVFGHQRNFALDNLSFKYEWILFLDADERSTDKFKGAALDSIAKAKEDVAGFYCCWKMMLENTWLKRSDNFPKWQFRLLRKGMAEFKDFGHGQKESIIKGRAEYIKRALSALWIFQRLVPMDRPPQ